MLIARARILAISHLVVRAHGRDQLAATLRSGSGSRWDRPAGSVLASYAIADRSAVWQAAGATGAFVTALGRPSAGWLRATLRPVLPGAPPLLGAGGRWSCSETIAIFASIRRAK
jgi:hypothetical protein